MSITLYNGMVADTPSSLTDKIRVSVPDIYTMYRQVYGPLSFDPIVSGQGGTRIPQAGDKAVVGVDEENGDSWLFFWYRDDPTPPPYLETGGSSGGGLLSQHWSWTTSVGAPATKYLGINTTAWATATQINISRTATDGTDVTNALQIVNPGQTIFIQDAQDSTKWGKYTVNSPGTNQGTWFSYPVAFVSGGSGGLPANNRDVVMAVSTSGVTGPQGPAGPTGPAGPQGPAGANGAAG